MEAAADIITYLQKFGISAEAGKVYLELLKQQRPSVLRLAKSLGISRPQAYRHIAMLAKYGLVNSEPLVHGTLYRALPLDNLDNVLTQREAETIALRGQLDTVNQSIQRLIAGASASGSDMRHYRGLAGLKQVNWNLTKAHREYRVFETAHLPTHFDKTFARRCNEQLYKRSLQSYDLTNATQVDASQLVPFDPAHTHYRHIEPSILAIAFEMYLYNGIITLLDYLPGSMHAVEIQNPAFYTMMSQMFTTMWRLGSDMRVALPDSN